MSESLYERHEREFADQMPGGRQTIASGRFYEKLDVTTELDGGLWRYLYSLKSSSGKGIRVTRELWGEAERAALEHSSNMRPALGLRLYGKNRAPLSKTRVDIDLVAVDVYDWAELLEDHRRLLRAHERSE